MGESLVGCQGGIWLVSFGKTSKRGSRYIVAGTLSEKNASEVCGLGGRESVTALEISSGEGDVRDERDN